MQNIPIKTELGRQLRRPFSHFAEQEARTYELVKGEDFLKRLLDSLPEGARIVSQIHDEISIEFDDSVPGLRELVRQYLTDPMMLQTELEDRKVSVEAVMGEWPPITEEAKKSLMYLMYGGREAPLQPAHYHTITSCSGRCSECSEQIIDSHDTRIKKLEQRLENMEANLRELVSASKTWRRQ